MILFVIASVGTLGWFCYFIQRKHFKGLIKRLQMTTSDLFEAEMKSAKQQAALKEHAMQAEATQQKLMQFLSKMNHEKDEPSGS